MNKATFCSLPFSALFLGPDGCIKPCCSSRKSFGNLNEAPLEDILQSSTAQDVRQSIINGEWNDACTQCKNQEAQGAPSERNRDIDKFTEFFGENIDKTTYSLQRLDLRWSNVCNLNCVYCYEFFSSKWAKINNIKVNKLTEERVDSLLLLVDESKDGIHNVVMLGGEPLLQKPNERLIKILSNKNFYILTNFAIPLHSNQIAQQLFNEPHATWAISFETVGERFEYVRRGSKWQIFLDNIEYYEKSARGHIPLVSHSLYSIYSAFNLVEFYEFIIEKKFNRVQWNLLESTGDFLDASIFKLPVKMKERAILEIDKCIELFPDAPGIDTLLIYKNTLMQLIAKDKNIISTNYHAKGLMLNELVSTERKLKDTTSSFSELWPEIYEMLNEEEHI
jgi:MoaA/NifB/PqqE/SkfB family radical SAM enzyme